MKKVLLLFIITLLCFSNPVWAQEDITPGLKKAYNSFVYKVQKKYSSQKEISYLQLLDSKLALILEKKNLTGSKLKLIQDLQKLNNEKIFQLQFAQIKKRESLKYTQYPISNTFSKKIYNPDMIFLENGVWYYYRYSNYMSFPQWTDINEKNLNYNNINKQKDIVFIMDDGNLGFITQYEKVRLIADEVLFWVGDKLSFLKEIKDDKKKLSLNDDSIYLQIKEVAQQLSQSNKKSQTIKNTYEYILENIEYTKQISLTDWKIFSGAETFKNWEWVCEWYTKLMKYILNFSGISDVEVIRGFVIDAQDFPQIGHAWIKIWNKYYDPTFDDPIWVTKTRAYDDYQYYNLPEDLFYTNRYNLNNLDESLKTKSLSYRQELVKQNIASFLAKYWSSNYNLLDPYTFRKQYWLKPLEDLSIEKIKKFFPYYEVDNFSYTDELGRKKYIKKLVYYTINDNDVEKIIKQFDYNIKDLYLFKWKTQEGNIEYRIGHNVEF